MRFPDTYRIAVHALKPWGLAAIALILIGIILAAASRSYRAMEEATFHEFNQRQLVMAREATRGMELYFDTLAGALNTLEKDPGVRRFEEEATLRLLSFELHELEHLGVDDILVLDASGRVRFRASGEDAGFDDSLGEAFLEDIGPAAAGGFTAKLFENSSGPARIVVSVPMTDPESDRTGGAIVCTLPAAYLKERFIDPVKPSEQGYAFLIDSDYRLIGGPGQRQPGENLLQGATGFPSFIRILKEMASGAPGTGEFVYRRFDAAGQKFTEGRVESLIAYRPFLVGDETWAFGVGSPKDEARKRIRTAYVNHLFLVSLAIVAILLGALYTTGLILRYNRDLRQEVESKTREFKESHQRLLTVLDSLDAAVYAADMESHEILFLNQYARNLYGDVAGTKRWQDLQESNMTPGSFCSITELIDSRGDPAGLCTREFQDKSTGKWYQAYDRAIRWVDDRLVKLEIAADVSHHKEVEEELKRAYHETGTFCRIIKQLGAQHSLDGVGSMLIKELQGVLNLRSMVLFIFTDDRSSLYALTGNGTRVFRDNEPVQSAWQIIEDLSDVTVSPQKKFQPPLLPADFPSGGRQTIIPVRGPSLLDGALVAACTGESLCDEKRLELVALILDQASGAIKRAVAHQEEITALQDKMAGKVDFYGIIGRDPRMQELYRLIEDISPTDATALIQGESGTGKELVARAIHRHSLRKEKPFVVINCAAYPVTLLESELFGHEKGAFTGAIRQKAGRFEQADGGTVFLDEIGEIPPSAQIRLLRVLQTQKFERVGGEKTLSVDVRIIAATNKDLIQEVKNGNFREDLFYRLNVIPIHMPPLRLRQNDIPLLARHFMRRFAKEQGKELRDLSPEAMGRLLSYHWPGNVRELENCIEHAVVLAKDSEVEISHLPPALSEEQPPEGISTPPASGTPGTMEENERRLLLETLEECKGNKSQAALRLGISRSTLYEKLKKYEIPPTSDPSSAGDGNVIRMGSRKG